jgi:histidinol-phosphate aminotransferase
VPDTQANFVFVVSPQASDLAATLDGHGLTVRPFPGDGVRISVGPQEANERVVEVMAGLRSDCERM